MSFEEKVLDALRSLVAKSKSERDVAVRYGINPSTLARWLTHDRSPKLESLGPILDKIGFDLLLPGETTGSSAQDVRFIAPRASAVVGYKDVDATVHPPDENYLAVPLVAERVAAGPSAVAESDVSDWVIVYNGPGSGLRQGNKDYFCIRVGKGQTSMIPTIHPGDILLVDPSDRDPGMNGRKIMLVKMPAETGDTAEVAVKRVNLVGRRGERSLMIYSDNVAEYPPLPPIPLSKYAANENEALERAIGGRVVWAWSGYDEEVRG